MAQTTDPPEALTMKMSQVTAARVEAIVVTQIMSPMQIRTSTSTIPTTLGTSLISIRIVLSNPRTSPILNHTIRSIHGMVTGMVITDGEIANPVRPKKVKTAAKTQRVHMVIVETVEVTVAIGTRV